MFWSILATFGRSNIMFTVFVVITMFPHLFLFPFDSAKVGKSNNFCIRKFEQIVKTKVRGVSIVW